MVFIEDFDEMNVVNWTVYDVTSKALVFGLMNTENGSITLPPVSGGAVYGLTAMPFEVPGFQYGEVRDFSFDKGGIPKDADVAFVMQAENLTPAALESVKSFMRDGKDVFLSYSKYSVREEPGGRYRVTPVHTGLEDYLADLGVRQENRILMEQDNIGRPYLIRVQGRQVNLDGFRLQRAGTMFFPFTSPITMPMRMASTPIPAVEIVASLALLVAGIAAVAWVAGKVYRVGLLSTGKRPTLAELARWVRSA
jgi:hypothetical protein